jgi:hypothetical protein
MFKSVIKKWDEKTQGYTDAGYNAYNREIKIVGIVADLENNKWSDCVYCK